MTKIIGNSLYHFRKNLIDICGNEKFNEILEQIPEDEKEILKGILTSSDHYELKIYQDLLEGIDKILGRDTNLELQNKLAEDQLKGIFGFFIKLLSIEKVLKSSNSMFQKIYSEGKIEYSKISENKVSLDIVDIDMTELYSIILEAYFKRIAELVTKKTVKITRLLKNSRSLNLTIEY